METVHQVVDVQAPKADVAFRSADLPEHSSIGESPNVGHVEPKDAGDVDDT